MTRQEIESSIKSKNSKVADLTSRKSALEALAGQLVFSNSESDILNMGQIGEGPKVLFRQVGAHIPSTGYNAYLMKLKNTINVAISQVDESISLLNMQVFNLKVQLIVTPEEV